MSSFTAEKEDSEQSSRIVLLQTNDDEKSRDNNDNTRVVNSKNDIENDEIGRDFNDEKKEEEEEKANNDDSTLETPVLSTRRMKRRSFLLRKIDEEANTLPSRKSMLTSQRIDLGADFDLTYSDDDDDNELFTKKNKSNGFLTKPLMMDTEQSSKPLKGIMTQQQQQQQNVDKKHFPDIVVTPTEKENILLTEDEIRKFHTSEDDQIRKSVMVRNIMKYTLGSLSVLLFVYISLQIGSRIGLIILS